MKKILFIKKIGVIMLSLLVFNIFHSCRKFITLQPPVTQLVTASVFDNDGAITAAQTVIYSKMSNESYNLSQNTGLLSDELANFTSGGSNRLFYINSIAATSNVGPWASAYNYIYQANAIIEGLQKTVGSNKAIKMQIIGESKFIRAFWHFYLTNLFGDVPLVTTTLYTINANISRTSRSLVYEQIIKDLKDAQSMLNSNYVDGSDTTITTDRVRPTKWAATAMLARVYLYTQQYDSAALEATKVIENTGQYSLLTNLNGVFLANSNEAIWQLAIPTPSNKNTFDGNQYVLIAAPRNVAISNNLLNSFETGDLRKTNWIGTITTTSPVATYYFPNKYKVRVGANISEYVMVLRLAEQYLIRAEARAQNGDIPGALSDIDTLRRRAGLLDYAGATDKNSVLAAILQERKVELFTEWGHRWFDLIRTGSIDTVLGAPGNVCHQKGGTWSSDGHQKLYPIWQSEMSRDRDLTQNPGY